MVVPGSIPNMMRSVLKVSSINYDEILQKIRSLQHENLTQS